MEQNICEMQITMNHPLLMALPYKIHHLNGIHLSGLIKWLTIKSLSNQDVFMKSAGFVDAGYDYINLDDCIVTGRDASGELIPDAQAFPNGVKELSDFVHSQGMKFGWCEADRA